MPPHPFPPCSCSLYFYVLTFFICLRVYALRAGQIKKTKTILRDYIYDIDGVCRRLSTAKNAGKHLSISIFYGTGFYKRQEKKLPR
jgi:hypothetical protein